MTECLKVVCWYGGVVDWSLCREGESCHHAKIPQEYRQRARLWVSTTEEKLRITLRQHCWRPKINDNIQFSQRALQQVADWLFTYLERSQTRLNLISFAQGPNITVRESCIGKVLANNAVYMQQYPFKLTYRQSTSRETISAVPDPKQPTTHLQQASSLLACLDSQDRHLHNVPPCCQ